MVVDMGEHACYLSLQNASMFYMRKSGIRLAYSVEVPDPGYDDGG